MSDEAFLSRWSRRKAQARDVAAGVETPEPKPAAPEQRQAEPPVPAVAPVQPFAEREQDVETPSAPVAAPAPTLDDVAALTRGSDYSRFVAPGVDETVKRAAMKKLFSDPHFNVMDGLDVYIDDYNAAVPLTEVELRKMAQSTVLRLFEHDEPPAQAMANPDGVAPAPVSQSDVPGSPEARVAASSAVPPDEDPDLRLQPDDAARRPGVEPGAGPKRG
jgi:hypothetical protein